MKILNLPPFQFRHQSRNGKVMIFDIFRKMYVRLTPEEWVRQHFLMWLVNDLAYPQGLIAVETSLVYNNLKKRADAVVYNPDARPLMLIECKAPEVVIDQATFEQAARYNFAFRTRYLVLTNGMSHYCCKIDADNGTMEYLPNIPPYNTLIQ
jgi:hypothetical protein